MLFDPVIYNMFIGAFFNGSLNSRPNSNIYVYYEHWHVNFVLAWVSEALFLIVLSQSLFQCTDGGFSFFLFSFFDASSYPTMNTFL